MPSVDVLLSRVMRPLDPFRALSVLVPSTAFKGKRVIVYTANLVHVEQFVWKKAAHGAVSRNHQASWVLTLLDSACYAGVLDELLSRYGAGGMPAVMAWIPDEQRFVPVVPV
jgi:hypothetical protein